MQNVLERKSATLSGNINSEVGIIEHHVVIIEHHIEALKTLASLLKNEVESLENQSNTSEIKGKINLSDELEKFETSLIREALIRSRGHQRKAAKLLGTKISTLNAKIKRYGIEPIKLFGTIN